MKNISEVSELFKKYESTGFFTGQVSLEQIKSVEKDLNIKFSIEYKWFVENFGSGGVLGIDILGIGKNGIETVKNTTLRLREKFQLEEDLYILEDCDEFFYCCNSNDNKIYYRDRDSKLGEVVAPDFLTFMKNRILEMKDSF